MKTTALAACLGASFIAHASAQETTRCGELSVRVVADKQGDYTLAVQIDRQDAAVRRFGSLGEPQIGCLRDAAVVLSLGDPVEGEIVIVVFANGRSVAQLGKETDIDFRDGRATVKQPIPLQFQDPANVPPEFRDLFTFL